VVVPILEISSVKVWARIREPPIVQCHEAGEEVRSTCASQLNSAITGLSSNLQFTPQRGAKDAVVHCPLILIRVGPIHQSKRMDLPYRKRSGANALVAVAVAFLHTPIEPRYNISLKVLAWSK